MSSKPDDRGNLFRRSVSSDIVLLMVQANARRFELSPERAIGYQEAVLDFITGFHLIEFLDMDAINDALSTNVNAVEVINVTK